jgi:hypothetical protein
MPAPALFAARSGGPPARQPPARRWGTRVPGSRAGRRASASIARLVPLAVKANTVVWGKHSHQMPFETVSRASGEPARACAPRQFLVHHAVITDAVIRCEDHSEVVRDGFIVEFREPAQALGTRHLITFLQ